MIVKRNILTRFVPALLIATSISCVTNAAEIYNRNSNKINLYGKIVGLHHFSDNSANNGDKTYALLGFKNETQVNNQLTAYGHWEHNFLANKSEVDGPVNFRGNNNTYLAYAGIKTGSHGSFDYGRNYGIIHDAIKYTMVSPEFGGDVVHSDNFFAGRISNVATYRNNDFFGLINGLNFGLQYLGKNEHADKYVVSTNLSSSNLDNILRSNGEGWGTSLSYEFDNFSFVGAYGAADRTNAQEDLKLRGKGTKAEQWATGLKYDANNFYLAANYGETHNSTPIPNGFANETKDVLLVAQYRFDFGLYPSIAYIKSKAKNVEEIGNENLVKYIGVGTTFSFNKNMSTYFDYKINQINTKNKFGLNSDNTFALGVVYKF